MLLQMLFLFFQTIQFVIKYRESLLMVPVVLWHSLYFFLSFLILLLIDSFLFFLVQLQSCQFSNHFIKPTHGFSGLLKCSSTFFTVLCSSIFFHLLTLGFISSSFSSFLLSKDLSHSRMYVFLDITSLSAVFIA